MFFFLSPNRLKSKCQSQTFLCWPGPVAAMLFLVGDRSESAVALWGEPLLQGFYCGSLARMPPPECEPGTWEVILVLLFNLRKSGVQSSLYWYKIECRERMKIMNWGSQMSTVPSENLGLKCLRPYCLDRSSEWTCKSKLGKLSFNMWRPQWVSLFVVSRILRVT